MEPSEKVAISFIVGGIGSYITAKHWLEAAGEQLDVMLHTSIYTNGISTNKSHTWIHTNAPTSDQTPDYLIQSRSGDWHVFESKGGSENGRYSCIQKGLLQLDQITQLAWKKEKLKPVTTRVCTHTSIEAGKPLKVLAYDPPVDNTTENTSLYLDKAVCILLKIIESLDHFHSISATPLYKDGWVWKTMLSETGLEVALPPEYFEMESQLRASLGLYLLVREHTSFYDNKHPWSAVLAVKAITNKATRYYINNEYNIIMNKFMDFAHTLIDMESPVSFTSACRQMLNLDVIYESYIAVQQRIQILSSIKNTNTFHREDTNVITTSGMLIKLMKPKKDQKTSPSR